MKRYFKQETDFTCAIACIRMVTDTELSESELAKMSGTSPNHGTHPKDIVSTLYQIGHEAVLIEGGENGIELIRKYKNEGFEIILLISVDVPHCVVYRKDDNNYLFYDDPYFGENKSIRISKFTSPFQKYPYVRWEVETKSLKKYYPEQLDTSLFLEGQEQFIAVKKKNNQKQLDI